VSDDEQRNREDKAAQMVALLKRRYINLIERGLGAETLSTDEEKVRKDIIDDAVSDVFALYAKVMVADALNIVPWLAAAMTGQFLLVGREDEDEDDEE
jgi:hypothetical protein